MATPLLRAEPIDLTCWAGLLSPETCAQLIHLARERLQTAQVSDEHTGENVPHGARISEMAWPRREDFPVLQELAKGIARLVGTDVACLEPLQILHYRPGGEYQPHFDAFAADSPTLSQGGNRQWTLIFYLNAVEGGGETAFPELGLRIFPIPGAGVLFRNLETSGQRDPLSLHAGLPVLKGEKWIATQWIRQGPYV